MKNKPIIETENIGKSESKDLILRDVTFHIYPNEFVSLKGPSGCGKTTLLRMLAGLTAPDKGKILINGKLANNPQIIIPPYKRSMNMLFQNLSLWPHMTGREQLQFVLESNGVKSGKEQIEEVCDHIGLPFILLEKYPTKLSRGEQQRLAIARAVINQPVILLLDEPFTALDHDLRKQFVTFMHFLRKEKKTTIILVSHDLVVDMVKPDKEIIYFDKSFRTHITG